MTEKITRKKVVSEVLKLALPAIGEMSLYMLIWTIDTILVGKFGGDVALSAVGMSSQFLYTFVDILITIGISVALTSMIARLRGAGDIKKGEEIATHGMLISVCISFVMFLIFFVFADGILSLFKADGEVLRLGKVYMKIASFAVFFNMMLSTLNGILRGLGNTMVPFIASIVLVIVNVVLDVFLIFGINGHFRLGVAGAAIATLIANIIALIFVAYHFVQKSTFKLRMRYVGTIGIKSIKEILGLAIPSGMQEGAFSICRLINSMMIFTLGQAAFAANQITVSIESISFMPGWGIAVAATTLVGNKVGEKDYEGAKQYGDACLYLGSLFMGICGICFFLFPRQIGSVFLNEESRNVLDIARLCIMIAAIEQIPTAISMIGGGALKGLGDTKTPFLIALFSNWAIRMPLMILSILILKLDITFVWYITGIQWIVDALLMLKYYNKKFKSLIG